MNDLGISKMKSSIISTALILSFYLALGQTMPYDYNSKLQLTIQNKKVILKPGEFSFELTISIKNKSDHSFILYDFKESQPGGTNPEDNMTPNWVGGNSVFIFQNSKFQFLIDVSEAENSEFIKGLKSGKFLDQDSAQLFDSLLSNSGKKMRDNLIVLKNGETWTGKLLIKLDKFWLTHQDAYYKTFAVKANGESDLYLIFSTGENITNLIDPEIIQEDEKKYLAVMFQGYVKSNSIKLFIPRYP